MLVDSSERGLILPRDTARNLKAVGKHLSDVREESPEDYEEYALSVLVGSYITQYNEDFVEADGYHVYRGTGGVEYAD